jgi:LuxR family transcriptional regulator, maltose regulon positive regulatory protein
MPKVASYRLTWSFTDQTYQLQETRDQTQLHIVSESPAWFAWLEQVSSFAFRGKGGHYTARKEKRPRGEAYWYAYVGAEKKLTKKYLGKTADVTLARLEQVAVALAGQGPAPGRDLPTGTTTLLFTDIEGSTRLLQRLGKGYADVLTACRQLLRAAFEQHHGHEVDTQGDASFVVFARASDAVAAAVAAQRALTDYVWPEGVAILVRMGLHTGEPLRLAEGYVGLDTHQAARIMNAGHGRQVLLSQTTRELVDHTLPEGVSLRDLGEHHLKDLQRPIHLSQLVIAGLAADFPPLKTIESSTQHDPLLATKLHQPRPRSRLVPRTRLIERLQQGMEHALTLISAPAGFGKTTLLAQWLAESGIPAAWLSLDAGENDLARFLAYLVAAVQVIAARSGERLLEVLQAPQLLPAEMLQSALHSGEKVLGMLQSPQPPLIEGLLTALLNDLTTIPDHFVLVLDDYQVIDAQAVDQALTFLLEHLPSQMHLVIATREDPQLPLARFRARDQLTELRAADLRFTPDEAAAFLNDVMGLPLSAEAIAALEARTEGWIAGLQLAALSLQGHEDAASFIWSFTGSHQFVLDYLVEEVLHQQPGHIQTFLLRTSILERLCGQLCEAVALDSRASGQATLDYLERANLFLVPLDHERRWYRYHHLFAEVLRQRLHQRIAASSHEVESQVNALHLRASAWYEAQGLSLEAFQHAAAANDVERAERLEGEGMPLHFRGAAALVLDWLASLPKTVLDGRPSLWVRYASALSMTGQLTDVEEKLQAAEAILQGAEPDDKTRNLIGHIAAIRALLAAAQYQVEPMLAQSRRALEDLRPDNLAARTATTWILGFAYQLQGDRARARRAYTEAIDISQASGNISVNIPATLGLGLIQEADNQLYQAAETYRHVLHLVGAVPLPLACEAHLGLARIYYEWNDLEAAEQHAQQSLHLARQYERVIDRFVSCEVFLARLKLTRGDVAGAATILAETAQSARQHNFVSRIPEVAEAQVLTLLRQGSLSAAAHLAQAHDLPLSQARVHLAQGNPSAALAVLESWRGQVEARGWQDERLKVLVLQALALQAEGEQAQAVQVLLDALALAEPGDFIRTFIDDGPPMAHLLAQAAAQGMMPDYLDNLLAAGETKAQQRAGPLSRPPTQPLLEPLSQREVEVLQLIAKGCSDQEISERLVVAVSTVKGHNRNIFSKLQVHRRTEAVARARALGLL